MKALLISSFFVFLNCVLANAQTHQKRDTVYFLVDIDKIQPNDNIISVNIEGPAKWFVFNCQCLKYNNTPTFYSIINKQITISRQKLRKLKFIPVTRLMQIVKANDNYSIDDKYSTWFVEKQGRKYIMQRAFFMPSREPINDTVTIQADTSKK